MTTLLAFDTATERMSIALMHGTKVWARDEVGGAQASATLIPAILALLAEAGITLAALDAIAFGRGPGAFTGLRTACSVAQGLAFGASKPVLPIDTLLAVAEDARDGGASQSIWATMDARMNEIYAAHYRYSDGSWTMLVPPFLTRTDELNERWQVEAPQVIGGSALKVFPELQWASARLAPDAAPRAQAMLPLALALWNEGGAVDPALAIPLYVRDKVAQTTAEREAIRAAKEQSGSEAA